MFRKIVNTILAFLILFGFSLPIIHNSTVLAAILIVVTRPYTLFNITKALQIAYVRKIGYYILAIILLSVFVAFYNQTGELAIIRSLLNQLFIFFTILLFYTSLNKTETVNNCHWYLLNAYVLQSVIILLAYNFSVVEDFVRLFQTEEVLEVTVEGYKGFRGLAIAAAQFYWLSGAYAMMLIIFTYKILEQKGSLLQTLLFFIVFAAALFTGRTIFIGLFFALALVLLSGNIAKSIKFYAYSVLFISLVFVYLPSSFFETDFFEWSFELFLNYEREGELSTRSSDHLVNKMLYMPELKTFFVGDGLWATNGYTDAYYGDTDSGIMRVLLFYGIGGVFIYFMFARFVTFGLSKLPQLNNKLGIRFLYLLILFQLVLNIKGQSLSYMTSTQAILFMFFLPYVFFKIKKIN